MSQSLSIRALSSARGDGLARVVEAGLVSQGRVFTLSLQPVREQLGDRWPARKDHVWETVERALVRRMPAPDVFLLIDEVTVMAAIASTDAYEGQVRCADVLRTVLAFFLGRTADGDLGISRVSDLTGGMLTCEPVNLMAPAPRAVAGSAKAGQTPVPNSPDRWTPPLGGRRLDAPLMSERLGSLVLTIAVEPVWRLDQGAISAYALRRRLPVRPDALTDGDREQVAYQTIHFLVGIMEEYRREGGLFALIVPGTFSLLAARRPRLEMLNRCADVADIMRKVVILEMDGLGSGAPLGRASETAAMLKPFVRTLTACVMDASEVTAAMNEHPFTGMAIDATRHTPPRLEALIRSARRRTPNVVVHDVSPCVDESRLRDWGASHVTIRSSVEPPASVAPDAAIASPAIRHPEPNRSLR